VAQGAGPEFKPQYCKKKKKLKRELLNIPPTLLVGVYSK
jgi:hypothetical protein